MHGVRKMHAIRGLADRGQLGKVKWKTMPDQPDQPCWCEKTPNEDESVCQRFQETH